MAIPQVTPPADGRSLLWAQDENLARMFAASIAFQEEVGTDGNAEPILDTLNNHIFDWKAVVDANFESCRVLTELGNITRTLGGAWSTTGEMPLMIERWQPIFEETNEGYRTSKAEFMRFVSTVLSEVEKRSMEVSETILGFSPMRCNAYSLVAGPHLVPASETDYGDVQVAEADRKVLWWIEFSFQVN